MTFASAYKRNKTEPVPSGSKLRTVYSMAIDEDGHKYLKATGKTNVYETIQASLEETKIENIIAMCAMGDDSGLRKKVGQYLDVTDLPTTLAEAQRAIQDVSNQFYELPLELRAQFNNSPTEYIAKYGTQEWGSILSKYANKTADGAAVTAGSDNSKTATTGDQDTSVGT